MPIATLTSVPPRTSDLVREEIAYDTLARLSRCAHSNALIHYRLGELEREWNLEGALQTWCASVALAGVALGAGRDRRWFALPAVAAGFMLQHALQGWCLPLPLFRRLGFRTQGEIARERYALKGMRGDFAGLGLDRGAGCAQRAYDAAGPS
jgi:hypothetical protein